MPRKRLWVFALTAMALAVPRLLPTEYSLRIATMICLYAILALGLNLVTGITGQLSLGHAAFYGVGAYVSALLAIHQGWSFLPVMIVSGLVACFFGVLLGAPTLRLSGDYLCIVTIGFAEIVRLVFQNWVQVTRGPMGIPGIPPISLLGFTFRSSSHYYYFFLAVAVLAYICISRILDSKVGRALVSIREDEVAASSMGINTTYYKVVAFAVGALFAGIAGSLMAHYLSFISPMNFTVDESLLILQMTILGGLGSNFGAVVGAAILVVAPEVLRVVSDYRMFFNGTLMVLLMILRPQGLFGTAGGAEVVRIRLRARRPAGPDAAPAGSGAGKGGGDL
ncbi:MAG: branched-chain amino acid ABC transporter permease [Ignavibacteriales bacterium]